MAEPHGPRPEARESPPHSSADRLGRIRVEVGCPGWPTRAARTLWLRLGLVFREVEVDGLSMSINGAEQAHPATRDAYERLVHVPRRRLPLSLALQALV